MNTRAEDLKVGAAVILTGANWGYHRGELGEIRLSDYGPRAVYLLGGSLFLGYADNEGWTVSEVQNKETEKADELPTRIRDAAKKHVEDSFALTTNHSLGERKKEVEDAMVDAAKKWIAPKVSHYQFPNGIQVGDISKYLTSFGGQAVQYIARSTRLDGNNKGDVTGDIRKAIDLMYGELERLEAAE